MNNAEIENLIKEILIRMSIPADKVLIDEGKPVLPSGKADATTWFSIEVKEPHFFSERGGEALFALNHLVRKMIENKQAVKSEEKDPGILIDINGFQKKRVENIHAIAHMMAERARYFKSNIEIDPMPAFERRIVHEFLSDATDLKTESQGEGHSRRVVIKYIGAI